MHQAKERICELEDRTLKQNNNKKTEKSEESLCDL